MALNSTMKGLLVKPWASMMVENSYRQERDNRLHRAIQDDYSIRYVIDTSQVWADTPQHHRYWSGIVNRL